VDPEVSTPPGGNTVTFVRSDSSRVDTKMLTFTPLNFVSMPISELPVHDNTTGWEASRKEQNTQIGDGT
jgi:hypothetical protein